MGHLQMVSSTKGLICETDSSTTGLIHGLTPKMAEGSSRQGLIYKGTHLDKPWGRQHLIPDVKTINKSFSIEASELSSLSSSSNSQATSRNVSILNSTPLPFESKLVSPAKERWASQPFKPSVLETHQSNC